MYTRSLLTFVLLAFCTLNAVLASPPPPPSINLLSVTSPAFGSVYHVGQDIHVKISMVNGTAGALYKANPKLTILLQKSIRLPLLNVQVGSVSAHTMYRDGFKFKVDKKYLIKEQANVPFRVRISFDLGTLGGYADSPAFKLVK